MRYYIVFLIALALLVACLNIAYVWMQTSNPNDTSIPETAVVLGARHLMQGESLYSDFHKTPFNLSPYNPGYTYLLAVISKAAHFSLPEMFVSGRRIVLAFTLMIALFIFVRVHTVSGFSTLAFLSSLLFLSCFILWPTACTNRPDVLAVLLSLTGFLLFVKFVDSPLRFLSLLLFLAAFITKQSAISAPFAAAGILALRKQWKHAVLFGLLFVLFAAIFVLLLHSATNGLSTLNTISANAAPLSLNNVRLIGNNVLQSAGLLLILGIAAVFVQPRSSPDSVYFLVSLAVAVFTSAKLGSAANYYLEPIVASCLIVPKVINRIASGTDTASKALLAAVFLIMMVPQANYLAASLHQLSFPDRAAAKALTSSATGFVVSDDPHISAYAKSPFFVDPFNLSYLESTGKWNPAPLVKMFEDGDIQYVLLLSPIERPLSWEGFTRLPSSAIRAIRQYYYANGTVDSYFLYIHRSQKEARNHGKH